MPDNENPAFLKIHGSKKSTTKQIPARSTLIDVSTPAEADAGVLYTATVHTGRTRRFPEREVTSASPASAGANHGTAGCSHRTRRRHPAWRRLRSAAWPRRHNGSASHHCRRPVRMCAQRGAELVYAEKTRGRGIKPAAGTQLKKGRVARVIVTDAPVVNRRRNGTGGRGITQ